MFLLVAGDVEPKEVFRLANKYFSAMKPYEGERGRVPGLPVRSSGPTRVYGHGKGTPSLSISYRVPPGEVESEVAFDLLAMHLEDPEGALRKRLVEELGVATSVSAGYDGMRFGGSFDIRVRMKAEHRPEEAEAIVLESVQNLLRAPLPPDEVGVLARRYRSNLLGSFKNEMRVGFLFLRREIMGSWKDIGKLLDRADTITPSDLQETAKSFFGRSNRVVGIYEKAERTATEAPGPLPEEPRGTAPPAEGIPASWKDLRFDETRVKIRDAKDCMETLSNGIRVVIVPDSFDPVFRVSAILLGGTSQDPPGKEGLHRLLASVSNRSGLPGMTRKEIRQKLEDLVGEAGVSSGYSGLTFSLNTFKEDGPEGLKLFKRLILETELDGEKLEPEKARAKSDLSNEDTRPRALCSRNFRELLWGRIGKTRRPSQESFDAVELKDLEGALDRHRDPRRCILTVSGDFERKEMLALLEKNFGDWKAGSEPLPDNSPGTPALPKKGLHVMDFDASQGYVMIGAPTLPKSEEGFAGARALSRILSRRIFNRIRSKEGLAYQAGARLNDEWEIPSLFYVIFQTKARSVPFAVSLALDELKKIGEEGPTEEELSQARLGAATALMRTMGKGSDRADAFASLLVHPSAGLDWHEKYWTASQRVNADTVKKLAKGHLQRDDLLILCVGKLKGMMRGDPDKAAKLRDFGPMTPIAPPAPQTEPKSPRDVVLHLIRRISSGDVEGMKPYLSEEYRKQLETPAAANRLKMQGRLLGQADVKVLGTEETGDAAAVTVRFQVTMGEQKMALKMGFDMVRAGDKWVCKGFKPLQ
jgi:zinc protease